jgi:hypothetical protein
MQTFKNLLVMALSLALAANIVACAGKKGTKASQAVKADGSCADEFLGDAQNLYQQAVALQNGGASAEALCALRAKADLFSDDYAGVKCQGIDPATGKTGQLVVNDQIDALKSDIDKVLKENNATCPKTDGTNNDTGANTHTNPTGPTVPSNPGNGGLG